MPDSESATILAVQDQIHRSDTAFHFGIAAICAFLLMMVINYVQHNNGLAILDLFSAITIASLLLHLKKTRRLSVFVSVAISMECILLLYFFIVGTGSGSGFVWSYALPLTSLSLCGMRSGLLISSLYLLCCIAVNISGFTEVLYSRDFMLRFSLSYGIVTLLTYLYEVNLKRYRASIVELNSSLEQKVAERTTDLTRLIEEKDEARKREETAKNDWIRTFDAVDDQIFLLDEHFVIVRANKAAKETLGVGTETLLGKRCHQIVHGTKEPPPYCPYARMKMLESAITCTGEFFEERLQRYFQVSVSPIQNEDGSFFGAVHIVRDITEKKWAEEDQQKAKERLRKAEKMEAIGLMAGGVAHDLNNILSGVVSYPDMLLVQMDTSDPLYKPLHAIRDTGRRAAAVVDDLLTIARGVVVAKRTHDLNTIILDFLGAIEYRKQKEKHPGVTLSAKLSSGQCPIVCSPVHMQKVLMNLIINGMEAIVDSGTVRIATEIGEAPDDPGQQEVILSVRDSGTGISPEDLRRIFEPFYTKKLPGRKGTGLGLAVVWNIVENHGAVIDVQSDRDGSVFSIRFAMSEVPVDTRREDINIDTLRGNGTILVVDDEPSQRQIARQMLVTLGYTVTTVASGQECIDHCRTSQVDLLLLDMIMEPGISGLQTYREVLAHTPAQKALITSGFSRSDDVAQALHSGPSRFLRKPYSMTELGLAIKELL